MTILDAIVEGFFVAAGILVFIIGAAFLGFFEGI